MLTGDLGEVSSFPRVASLMEGTGIPWRYILGNHDEPQNYLPRPDWAGGAEEPFPYYAMRDNRDLLIFLDTHESAVDGKQRAWLESLLQGPEERLIIFSHHPLYDCGGTIMDRRYPLEEREALTGTLEKTGKAFFLFCGHYHTNHEQKIGNVFQAVTPSLIIQLKKFSGGIEPETEDFGYRIINIRPSEVSSSVRMFDADRLTC